ncbi:MAG: hypothetical protein ABR599_07055, partial [Gemmatimonadota bacterium]
RLRRGRAFLYLALALPLAVGTWISVGQGLHFSRYFLFCSPYLALLLAAGLSRMGSLARAAALGVLLLSMGHGLVRYWSVSDRDSDYRPVGRWLTEHARPGERILAVPADNQVSLRYYLRDTPLESAGLEPDRPLLEQLGGGTGPRTWLVIDYRSPLYGASPRRLGEELGREPLRQRRFGKGAGVGVLVLALPAPAA